MNWLNDDLLGLWSRSIDVDLRVRQGAIGLQTQTHGYDSVLNDQSIHFTKCRCFSTDNVNSYIKQNFIKRKK